MANETLVQFVAFATRAPLSDFIPRWRPIASSFLRAGVQSIELFEVATVSGRDLGRVRFLSRNTWTADAYRRTFPAGLPADSGAGEIQVTQLGVFHLLGATTPPVELDKSLVAAFDDGTRPDAHSGGLLRALERDLPETGSAAVYLTASSHGLQPYSIAVTWRAAPEDSSAIDTVLRERDAHLEAPFAAMLAGREVLTLVSELTQ